MRLEKVDAIHSFDENTAITTSTLDKIQRDNDGMNIFGILSLYRWRSIFFFQADWLAVHERYAEYFELVEIVLILV